MTPDLDQSHGTESSAPKGARIERLVGVYDANGTIRGELAYVIGRALGRRHCALCDITHGTAREKGEWRECRSSVPVPFDTYHLNDQPPAIRSAIGTEFPAVVAVTNTGIVLLLGPQELEGCHASPSRMVEAISVAASQKSLVWAEQLNEQGA
jgi:hypothetical protein